MKKKLVATLAGAALIAGATVAQSANSDVSVSDRLGSSSATSDQIFGFTPLLSVLIIGGVVVAGLVINNNVNHHNSKSG